MNYFELFNLPFSFKVDQSILAEKYFELQRKNHPDYFTNATEIEQDKALQQSALLNQALKILKQDDEIIKYVLQLKGIIMPEEKYTLPPDFLMEIMEINEEISNTSSIKISKLEDNLFKEIEHIINNPNFENITPSQFQKVKEYYYKKKYVQRILDRMQE